MDFECDFNGLNFCQYSNLGWGFQKSVRYRHTITAALNFPNIVDYFPCSVSIDSKGVSLLEKKISFNSSRSLCLWFDYFLEENGQITVVNGKNKWTKNSVWKYLQWEHVRFPINFYKNDQLTDKSLLDSSVLTITGQSVCVDNFTVSTQPCPITTRSLFDNSFSLNATLWLVHPFSILVAIVTLMILMLLVGLVASIVFARRSQKTLYRSKEILRKFDQHSLGDSLNLAATVNSSCDIDCRYFAHQNRFLPSLVHVHSNPKLVRYSKHSFTASSSAETCDSVAQCRLSLALTDDAQLLLLSANGVDRLQQQQQQYSLPSPSPPGANCRRPMSVVITSTLCATILDQSESDLSLDSVHIDPIMDRRRPIRESMNVGYVSDCSMGDLPQYDIAVRLLAEHKLMMTPSPGDVEDHCNNNNVRFVEYY